MTDGASSMSDMGLYEAMSTQRAVRRLRPDAISAEILERVLQAASWAPSGANTQPWRIVLVRDAEKKAALGKLYAQEWARFAAGYTARMETLEGDARAREQRTIQAGDYIAEHFHEAPAVAVFCFNPKMMAITDLKQDRVSVVGGGSVYPAVQNLLLAARAEGLGCVLTTILCGVEPQVKQILSVAEGWGTAAAVPLGYPVGKGHGAIRRRDSSQLVFDDSFGQPHQVS
jgi:nitroreductase